jgi:D-xylose transport system permease protein
MSTATLIPPVGQPEQAAQAKGVALRDFTMVIALVAIWAFFAIMSPSFLGARNLSNLAVELSITAVLALGMLLILLTGQIDLSIGSGLGLYGGVAAVLIFEHNWPAGWAMLAGTILAIIISLGMGTLIVRERVPAFIATLAGMLVLRGVQWRVIHNATIPVQIGGESNAMSMLTTFSLPAWVGIAGAVGLSAALAWGAVRNRQRRRQLGLHLQPAEIDFLSVLVAGQMFLLFVLVCNQFRGVPLSAVILAAAAAVVWVITQHTRFGRSLYAVGGNEDASRLSGIPVRAVTIAAYGIMGLLTALGGFMQTAYAGAATTTIGTQAELDAVAACVIGGTSLKGGRGSVMGVIFGSLIMASLLNGMTLLAVSPETKYIARGAVLALAVWLDMKIASKKA